MGFFNLTKVCGRLGNRKAKEFFEKVRVFREYYVNRCHQIRMDFGGRFLS